MFPIIRCQCQQEQYEKEEAKRKHQEFLEHISRLKSSGLQDPALREFTFAHDNGINPEIEKAKNYVTHWEEIKSKAMGLLLWGDVGTGKSFFAGCVANALLDKGVPVLMTNFAKILNSLTGIYPQDRNEFINSLNQYSLLIIDDLGVERNSEFALEQVFHVIDSRYRSMKPMIITTNLTLEELKHPEDLAHSRIYDRISCSYLAAFVIGKNALALCGSFHRTDRMRDFRIKHLNPLPIGTLNGCGNLLRNVGAWHYHCHKDTVYPQLGVDLPLDH